MIYLRRDCDRGNGRGGRVKVSCNGGYDGDGRMGVRGGGLKRLGDREGIDVETSTDRARLFKVHTS